MRVTNLKEMPLALAVWALHDNYDYQTEENYISATSLMKPLKQLILPKRMEPGLRPLPDVEDFIARASGHAYHDSIEKAWKSSYAKSLRLLGYTDAVINRIKINPEPSELEADSIPIYLEQRAKRKLGKYVIGGKFDMVAEGIVQDYKSTSAFVWVKGSRDDEHALQGSIYRWLNPDKITEDFIRINYIFTDWQKFQARSNPNYPSSRVMCKDVPLLSLEQTENWIKHKLDMYEKYFDAPENEIPDCTDAELWRSDPQYKYYANPEKTDGRSTKNFDTLVDARAFMSSKGGIGIVKTVPGEPKRCGYCDAFEVCQQKDRYFQT